MTPAGILLLVASKGNPLFDHPSGLLLAESIVTVFFLAANLLVNSRDLRREQSTPGNPKE